jgi:periplasmic protein TonB
MLEVTTTLGGRALALVGSALFHAGVVVVLGGHANDPPASRREPSLILAVSLTAEDAPIVRAEPERTARPVARRVPVQTHTHRYPVAHQHDATPHDPSLVHAPLNDAAPTPRLPSFALALPVASAPAPRFAIQVSPKDRPSSGTAAAGGHSQAGQGEVLAEAGVDTPARLLRGATPPYPREAAEASIEADLPLEIVVDTKGHVVSARVLRQVGYGLEPAALRALRAYHFAPAILNGRPSSVRMKWTMVFRLQ